MRPIVPRFLQSGVLSKVCPSCESKIEKPIPKQLSGLCLKAKHNDQWVSCAREYNSLQKELDELEGNPRGLILQGSNYKRETLISNLEHLAYDLIDLRQSKKAIL